MRSKAISVASMAVAGFFLLAGYGVLRPISNSLFISDFGASRLPFVIMFVPLAIAAATLIYSHLLSSIRSRMTFLISTLSAALLVLSLYYLSTYGVPLASALLYLFTQTYIMLIVSQIWSFVNSTLSAVQAKRWNGPFTGVAQLGAVLGSFLTRLWAEKIGSTALLIVASILTIGTALFGFIAYLVRKEPDVREPVKKAPWREKIAWDVFRKEPAARGLLLMVACTQIIGTLLDVAFHISVSEHFPLTDARSAFLATFWQGVDLTALALQFLGAPLLLALLPLWGVHFLLPLVNGLSALAFAVQPSLFIAKSAFFLFKSLDYSIFAASKEILYIPLSFEARYRAKAVIDAFGNRTAKGITSLGLSGATLLFGALSPPVLAGTSLLFVFGWFSSLGFLFRKR